MKNLQNSNEQDINKVLKHQEKELNNIKQINNKKLEETIFDTEKLLLDLGYEPKKLELTSSKQKKTIVVPTWEEMCTEASKEVEEDVSIQDFFTNDELLDNKMAIKKINQEFKSLYKFDGTDVAISVFAGLIASVVDILLVGIPHKTPTGIKGGPLSNYVRDWFDKKYPEAEMEKLANSTISKVPYDAQDNRNTQINVEGLSAYYHRLLTVGHDPFLGLLFGVIDILNGTMTSIDKTGKIVIQRIANYSDRKENDIFSAITKQIIHFKSDVTTSMGLPAPFMSLFNLLQFGSIGEENQTIAEIVQGMYFEGYDFIQFCASSIPTLLIEVIVRMSYAIKSVKEGKSIKESIPFSNDRSKCPKLETMLYISHAIACSVNAGKIYFNKNPLAINYPEWLTFAKYSYKQLKWAIIQKPHFGELYVKGKLNDNMQEIYNEIDKTYNSYLEKYDIVLG